jgi:hypothetical protein
MLIGLTSRRKLNFHRIGKLKKSRRASLAAFLKCRFVVILAEDLRATVRGRFYRPYKAAHKFPFDLGRDCVQV